VVAERNWTGPCCCLSKSDVIQRKVAHVGLPKVMNEQHADTYTGTGLTTVTYVGALASRTTRRNPVPLLDPPPPFKRFAWSNE
jgi:hypothetical protein